jgi:hypothetical protein
VSARSRFPIAIVGFLVYASCGVGAAEPAVSLGVHHSVALARDGTVFTWGDDHAGQLGLGRRIKSAVPLPLTLDALAGAIDVLAAEGYSVAIAPDGKAWGWGAALAFGDGIGTDRSTRALRRCRRCARSRAGNITPWGSPWTTRCGRGARTTTARSATAT